MSLPRSQLAALTAITLCVTIRAPSALAEIPPPPPFKDFGIASADGKWSLKFGALIQPRFTYERHPSDDPKDRYHLSINRARVSLAGTALTKNLGYAVQLGWDKGGLPTLQDAYLDYRVHDWFRIRAGQGKKPFDREFINSSRRLQLADRSVVASGFGQGRDIGVTFHNDYEKSPSVEYALGWYNGTGDKTRFKIDDAKDTLDATNIPTRFHPMMAARLGYNHGNIKGYSEADLEGGPIRFGAAAGVLVDFNLDRDDSSGIASNIDFMLKAYGLSVTGAGFLQSIADPPPAGSGSFNDQVYARAGVRGQVGYTIRKLVEPAFRYARVIPRGPHNDIEELLGGLSVYPYGHSFKVQLDGGAVLKQNKDGESTTGLVRLQVQLAI